MQKKMVCIETEPSQITVWRNFLRLTMLVFVSRLQFFFQIVLNKMQNNKEMRKETHMTSPATV